MSVALESLIQKSKRNNMGTEFILFKNSYETINYRFKFKIIIALKVTKK